MPADFRYLKSGVTVREHEFRYTRALGCNRPVNQIETKPDRRAVLNSGEELQDAD